MATAALPGAHHAPAVLFALIACTPDTETPAPEVGKATVDASGGRVELEGGGLAVIPAGAVADGIELSMRPVELDLPGVAHVGTGWSFEPTGTVFEVPIDVYLPLAADQMSEDLVMAISDDDGETWDVLPTRPLPAAGWSTPRSPTSAS